MIILQGGGDHARVVLDCLQSMGVEVMALYDPKYSGELFGVPQKGAYNPADFPEAMAIIAIGNNAIRKRVAAGSSHSFANAIHRSSIISEKASIGEGNMILHRTVIQANAVIGNHVIVNTAASVDHDCIIGDFVHIAPGVVL
jgi:sugar O-acyltransferase (sialic acid O-acetyltransferase NeuD family)